MNYIPNLSRAGNEKIFSAYLLGEKGMDDCCLHSITMDTTASQEDCINCCPLMYPIAIHTNHSNRRISAQAGTFTAFSVHVTEEHSHYDLERIQKELMDSDIIKNAKPFLYKIIVHSSALEPLHKWIETAGIRTFNYYPELENMGKATNL